MRVRKRKRKRDALASVKNVKKHTPRPIKGDAECTSSFGPPSRACRCRGRVPGAVSGWPAWFHQNCTVQ